MKGVSYLLVKQSPEHGQRDVEEEHSEDHLHLRDQEFLVPRSRKKRVFLRSVANFVAECVDTLIRPCCTYIVLLLGPVHPVGPLGVAGRAVTEAVLDGELPGSIDHSSLVISDSMTD